MLHPFRSPSITAIIADHVCTCTSITSTHSTFYLLLENREIWYFSMSTSNCLGYYLAMNLNTDQLLGLNLFVCYSNIWAAKYSKQRWSLYSYNPTLMFMNPRDAQLHMRVYAVLYTQAWENLYFITVTWLLDTTVNDYTQVIMQYRKAIVESTWTTWTCQWVIIVCDKALIVGQRLV